jgi:tetratricopeptide (TPR) repeat protein
MKNGLAMWAAATLFGVASGCIPSRGAQMQDRVETTRRESEPTLLRARAEAYAEIGDYTRATQYLRAALAGGGDADEVLPRLVELEIKDQSYRAAAQHLAERLRSHPTDVRGRFVLGSLFTALGRPLDAERELLYVLAASPKDAEATFALAVVYRDFIGNYARADEYFRRYLQLQPSGQHRDEAAASTFYSVQ